MEKVSTNEEIKLWRDHLPLEYKYTAGVAGERFLQLLKQGKIQGSVCRSCNKTFVPPKIFCKDCFVQLTEWKDIPEDSGYLYSFTSAKKWDKDSAEMGNDLGSETIVLVKFDGVEGGIIGKFRTGREDPRIGIKVRAVFKPKDQRKGELADIQFFEKL
jgi:uncharacterized protein